jgi:hypothetical protein
MSDYTSVQLKHKPNDSKTTTDTKRDRNTIKESVVILDDLKRLHVFPQSTSQILPFSSESHLESLSSGACAVISNESMSNELLRLSSLSTFPREIDISMTRLARAGFYHSGNSGETKCFSCGITYNKWKSVDDPIAIHKKLSPSCNLVNNVGTNHSSVVENSIRVESKPRHSTSVPSIGISIQQQVACNHKSTTTTATQSKTATPSGENGATSTESELLNDDNLRSSFDIDSLLITAHAPLDKLSRWLSELNGKMCDVDCGKTCNLLKSSKITTDSFMVFLSLLVSVVVLLSFGLCFNCTEV